MSERNESSTTNPYRDAAAQYRARGWNLARLRLGEKAPVDTGWPNKRPEPGDFRPGEQVGILTGEPSGNLLDVDLDDTIAVETADDFLTPTGLVSGRKSKPRSHRWYAGDGGFRHEDFRDIDKTLIVELRGSGYQTTAPPSKHPSGEGVVWYSFAEPAAVSVETLRRELGRLTAAVSLIRDYGSFADAKHLLFMALAGALVRDGVDPDEIEAFVRTVAYRARDPQIEDRCRVVQDTAAKYLAGDERVTGWPTLAGFVGAQRVRLIRAGFGVEDRDGRAWVNVADGNLNRAGDETIKALEEANNPPTLFVGPGGALSRIVLDDDGRAAVGAVDEHALRFHATEVIKFTKPGKATKADPLPESVETPAPLDLLRNVKARPALPFPPLVQITRTPIFGGRNVASLRTESGYVEGARAYADLGGFTIPRPVSSNPSDDEIAESVGLMDELLIDFPFVAVADKAHAHGYGLLPYYRHLIEGPTPLHVFEGPTAGTGKGKLVDSLNTVATGRAAPALTEAGDDDEWRKKITTKALAGSQFFTIGNATRPLDSGALAEALTTEVWEDRVLGQNRAVQVPVRFIWAVTANNPTVSHEIARRSIRIRLDPKIDRPWLRGGFRHDLPGWAAENRPRLVWAFLTLWAAWIAASCPAGGQRLGSFDEWAKTIGGVLKVAGVPGFLGNASEFYEAADVEGGKWRALVAVWWETYGSTDVTAADLLPLAKQIDGFAFRSEKERGIRTEFGAMLRGKRDNHFTTDAGVLRVAPKGENREGVATYCLIHRDGAERPRSKDAENIRQPQYDWSQPINLGAFR